MNNLRILDESLEYLNEGKLANKIKDFIKKNREKKLNSTKGSKEKEEYNKWLNRQITPEEKKEFSEKVKAIVSAAKASLKKIQSSPDYKNWCKECTDALLKTWDYEEDFFKDECDGRYTGGIYYPPFDVDIYDEYDKYRELTLSIIDDTQEVRIEYGEIMIKIVDGVKEALPDIKFSVNYGDGDEGCIEFTICHDNGKMRQ